MRTPHTQRPRPFAPAEDETDREPEPVFTAAEDEENEPAETPTETPTPTWEAIDSAPRNGRDVTVRYSEDDGDGRVVRWKNGRHFTGRRWMPGGSWVPSDSMIPLPAGEPTQWLNDHQPDEAEEAAA